MTKPLKLYDHQLVALKKSLAHSSYGLFMETGTGKTPVAVCNAKHRSIMRWQVFKEKHKVLVICPLSIIKPVWEKELPKWWPGVKVQNLWRARKQGKSFDMSCDVFLINFESARKLNVAFMSQIHQVIVDESSKIKTFNSKITEYLHNFKGTIKHWLLMSGTPAPNSLLEYWSQMYLINDDILGHNYYRFRAINFYTIGWNKFVWLPKKEFSENIGKLLAKQSYAVRKEDCLDLEPQSFQSREYEMSGQQAKVYKQMLQQNIALIEDAKVLDGVPIVAANELVKIMKLRQITAGFARDEDGIDYQVTDRKLKLLMGTLDEFPNQPVTIWCQFHWEIKKIMGLLGKKAVMLSGLVKNQTLKDQAIEDYVNNRVQYMVAHPKSAAHGLDFTHSWLNVYFSWSYSYEDDKQSRDRPDRIGQTHKVHNIYLVADKSIDGIMYNAIRNKESISNAVLRDIHNHA